MQDATALLSRVFGFSEFRPGQAEIVEAVAAGRNVLAIMPTGGGKSLCFQLPALMREGVTVVISPLIALMRDQVRGLREAGVVAGALTSGNTPEETDAVWAALEEGSLKLLYIAPERLASSGTERMQRRAGVSLIAVDEAHCVSQWGHDFRPDYLRIGELRRALDVPLAAFTATADAETREEIVARLFDGVPPESFPEAEALELPFMTTKSAEEASRAAWTFTQGHLLDDFADVHLIAVHMHGRGLVHLQGPAIETLSDFDGLRLRGPSRAATLLLDRLGATPVGMPVPAFPEALSRGVVDGGVITWEQAPSLRLDELTESHTDVAGDHSLYNLYFLWAMNRDVYEGLPDDLRAVIDANSGLMASAWAGRAHDIGDADGRRAMEDAGNIIAEMSPDLTAEIRALGDQVIADWIAEADAAGLDGAGLVAAARAAMEAETGTAPAPYRD